MQKQQLYLKAHMIHRYLTDDLEELDTLVMCAGERLNLVTTDQSLYEAIGSIEDKTTISFPKLVKLLEVVDIISFNRSMKKPRNILKDERVKEVVENSKQFGRKNDGGKEN